MEELPEDGNHGRAAPQLLWRCTFHCKTRILRETELEFLICCICLQSHCSRQSKHSLSAKGQGKITRLVFLPNTFPLPYIGSGTIQKVNEHEYVLIKLYLQKQVVD